MTEMRGLGGVQTPSGEEHPFRRPFVGGRRGTTEQSRRDAMRMPWRPFRRPFVGERRGTMERSLCDVVRTRLRGERPFRRLFIGG